MIAALLRVALVAVAVTAVACGTNDAATPRPTGVDVAGAELRWTNAAALPTPRTELAVAALDGKVYAAGGFTRDGSATDAVEIYDPDRDAWTAAPSLDSARHHAALVGAAGRLYVIGGYDADGKALAEVASWAPGERAWRTEPDLPTARGALAAATLASRGGERIHAVGGASGFGGSTSLVSAHEVFDTSARRWVSAGALPRPRDHLAAAGALGKLYVPGGRELSLARNKAWLDTFDPSSGKWSRAGDMPTPRGGLAAAAVAGQVFVFGGEQPAGTFDEAEFYDIGRGKWFSGPKMPTARHGLGAATIGNRVYVVGGGPTPGLSVSGATEVLVIR